jgi:NADH-quinone oxidoreductase subunit J
MTVLAAIDWHAFFFWLFALLTCGFALAVLLTSNIVHMAFYLTLSLGASAGLFILAGAEFVGAMQLMIYVGGTLVLLIFGVMLTAQSRFISMKTPAGEWVLSLLVGGCLLFLLLTSAFKVEQWVRPHPDRAAVTLAEANTTAQLGLGLSGVRIDRPDQPDPVLREGMSGYLLPFVIVSVHLLVVLIGAAYMARSRQSATWAGPAG